MAEIGAAALVSTRIVALSAGHWAADPERCAYVVHNALEGGSARFLQIDAAALDRVRTPNETAARETNAAMHVRLADWLRITAQHYSADEERIAADLPRAADLMLWVDATAFDTDVLKDVLQHMRRVLFGAMRWPDTMIFILRDDVIQSAMDMLPRNFYLMPLVKSQREASLYAYNVHRIARHARLFGWSPNSIRGLFSGQRYSDFWRRLTRQDEVDYIK